MLHNYRYAKIYKIKRKLNLRARNSGRIRESILAMILVSSRYKNQFLSLNYHVVNTTVTQNFDSRKPKQNSMSLNLQKR